MLNRKSQRRVLAEVKRLHPHHENVQYVEEHGGRYAHCLPCGALWSVAFDGAGHPLLDVLEPGDESCLTNHRRKR